MKQIFSNHDFIKATKEIPLNTAERCYNDGRSSYEIWSLSEEDYKTLDSYIDLEDTANNENFKNSLIWKKGWGWWRWCNGSIIESGPVHDFYINNKKVQLYYSENALKDFADEIIENLCPSDIDRWPCYEGEIPEEIKDDYFAEYGVFNNIFDYCNEIWDCSRPKNVTAIITANAKLNNMAVSDFLNQFI